MATIVNTPVRSEESSVGNLLSVVLMVALVLLVLYFLLPLFRGGFQTGPTFSVPEKVDINVNQGAGTAK